MPRYSTRHGTCCTRHTSASQLNSDHNRTSVGVVEFAIRQEKCGSKYAPLIISLLPYTRNQHSRWFIRVPFCAPACSRRGHPCEIPLCLVWLSTTGEHGGAGPIGIPRRLRGVP